MSVLHREPLGDTERPMGMTLHHPPSPSRPVRRLAAAACAVGLLTVAAGCGDDETSSDTTAAAADATTAPVAGEVTFAGQWARTSPAMATAGAAYVTITSTIDDKLVTALVDPSIAATVEVHETVMADMTSDTAMSSDTAMGSDTTMAGGEGEMMMRPVAFIELPAGVAVELKPGGYHIMLLNLVEPLEVGTSFELTLVFEHAGQITIDVPVLEEAP